VTLTSAAIGPSHRRAKDSMPVQKSATTVCDDPDDSDPSVNLSNPLQKIRIKKGDAP
jgi:hypothetical protein